MLSLPNDVTKWQSLIDFSYKHGSSFTPEQQEWMQNQASQQGITLNFQTTETSGDKQEAVQSNLTAGIEPEVPAVNSEDPATALSEDPSTQTDPSSLSQTKPEQLNLKSGIGSINNFLNQGVRQFGDRMQSELDADNFKHGTTLRLSGYEKQGKALQDQFYDKTLEKMKSTISEEKKEDGGDEEGGGDDGGDGGDDNKTSGINGNAVASGLGTGFDIAGNLFGKNIERSTGEQAAWAAAQQIGKLHPIAGAVVSGLNAIDKIGGATLKGTQMQNTTADSAFGNSFNNSRSVQDKTVGLFAQMFGANGRQKRKVRQAQLRNAQVSQIADQANDWRAIANDTSNTLRRQAQLNGFMDDTPYGSLRIAAKEGAKLDPEFVFEKYIPEFEFEHYVPEFQFEKFKDGGSLEIEFVYSKYPIEDEFVFEKFISEEIDKFQNGGSFNVIPEGALHARKHNMEIANEENITKKGIPVVSENENGELEQQAEIELNEIIFRKEVTERIEKLWKEYEESKDDDLAIQAGKILVREILYNTDDRTGLIQNII